MHSQEERAAKEAASSTMRSGELSVTLTRRDVSAIDLALRVLLTTSTARDEFYEDVRRAREKLPRITKASEPRAPLS